MNTPLLLLNEKLWKDFGVIMERGQAGELFLFDSQIGLSLFDNIAHFSVEDGRGILLSKYGREEFPFGELLERLDSFLFNYFFGRVQDEKECWNCREPLLNSNLVFFEDGCLRHCCRACQGRGLNEFPEEFLVPEEFFENFV
jgi:hypothetical protein